MTLPPGVLLAIWMADRSVTTPGGGLRTSAKLLTLKTAGARRSSSISRFQRGLRDGEVARLARPRRDFTSNFIGLHLGRVGGGGISSGGTDRLGIVVRRSRERRGRSAGAPGASASHEA